MMARKNNCDCSFRNLVNPSEPSVFGSYFMALKVRPLCGEDDVCELLLAEQPGEHPQHVVLVVVPLEAVLQHGGSVSAVQLLLPPLPAAAAGQPVRLGLPSHSSA